MRRLPAGSGPAVVAVLAVLLVAVAFPDSFLFKRIFTIRRWPLPFTRDILVMHLVMTGIVLGWGAFTAWFARLRRRVAEAFRACEAAWGRLTPLLRDRAVVLARLERLLTRVAPEEGAFLALLGQGLEADGSALTRAHQVGAANMLTAATSLLPEIFERKPELLKDGQLVSLSSGLQGLEERLDRLRVPYNVVAGRFNRALKGRQFSRMAEWTGRAGEWPLLHGGRPWKGRTSARRPAR